MEEKRKREKENHRKKETNETNFTNETKSTNKKGMTGLSAFAALKPRFKKFIVGSSLRFSVLVGRSWVELPRPLARAPPEVVD